MSYELFACNAWPNGGPGFIGRPGALDFPSLFFFKEEKILTAPLIFCKY